MNNDERAIAWLDAHPEVVEAAAESIHQSVFPYHSAAYVWAACSDTRKDGHRREARAALVAFLTSPPPCAACGGKGRLPTGRCLRHDRLVMPDEAEWAEWMLGRWSWFHIGCGDNVGLPCPDCTDGTAGILLDQLERGSDGR